MTEQIGISLQARQPEFIRACFGEARGGASTREISKILRRSDDVISAAFLQIDFDDTYWTLPKQIWLLIFDVINASIYALGAFELMTLTGYPLTEAANTNLRISEKLFGCYGGCLWEKKNA